MDEAEITQALQADLNFFKVKVQVKHREDQLHILISRSQKNDVDYTVVFDAVQNSLAQKHLPVETFTVYGRVFGAKQPEWQCNGELPKLTDTAEFDLDRELDRELDFAELTDVLAENGAIELPDLESVDALAEDSTIELPKFESQVISNPTTIQVPDLTIDEQSLSAKLEMPEDLDRGEAAIASDFEMPEIPDLSSESADFLLEEDLEMPDLSSDDISDSIRADMSDFDTQDEFDMPEFSAVADMSDFDTQDEFDMPEYTAPEEFDIPPEFSTADESDDMPEFSAEDVSADIPDYSAPDQPDVTEYTDPDDFGMSDDYGTPDLSISEDLGVTAENNRQEPPTSENAAPDRANGKKYVGAIALLGVVALAGGGWFMFDRSAQEQKLTEARAVAAKTTIDPQQLGKLDALQNAQTQLQKAVTLLEEIPNRPGSYYDQAQAQLQTLRPRLQAVDAKLNIEKPAADKLENAKQLAKEAGIIVQNPPHKSEVWQTAQNKWQESLKLLEGIPKNSLASAEAQQKLELYRSNYTAITAQLQTQKQIDFAASLWPNGVTPDLQAALKQLKTSGVAQPQFINRCIATIRPRLNTGELQQRGFQPDIFSKHFCEYVASVN